MFEVMLTEDFEFSYQDVARRDYAKSLMTDCLLKFAVNGELIYDDWICPLELYFQYLDWKKDLQNNNICDFYYISDDSAVNPIFSFILFENEWIFCNRLTNKKANYKFTLFEVLEFFNLFEIQLLKHQKDIYSRKGIERFLAKFKKTNN